ncbi:PaaX family transcriptional regulator C-terminal domain-containing protein [Prosthecodimorpha staleyi]|uniref:Phenylacetic acid degradation operon negative regulatory protein PaaX n=1 Tax=Prosthecodimorpha staleyi TaxID=2840188 RepID=A0A947DAQ3_9HYPH|nr:PaaX family transcriptional regulator C-terminal domain-containing protein [Prosthecodimorpha staleyi]MBT9291792.1 phenylacetic acid degradation operon negative regulatory protein PaaX [Prosthecodimorpha staleyi]
MPERALPVGAVLPAIRHPALALALEVLHRRTPIRAWSLIVTMFGDCISPRGGSIGVGSLQDMAGSLGLDAGVVRTALTRLAADGLLERIRVGRNSFASLSPAAEADTRRVAPQIYRFVERPWDGRWRLAFLAPAGEALAETRAALIRQGFALVAPGLAMAPLGADGRLYSGRLPDLAACACLDAAGPPAEAPRYAAGLWPLEGVAQAYRQFLADFSAVEAAVAAGPDLVAIEALAVRIAVVHEFRRLALRDPLLPAEILPADWPGRAARALAGRLYGRVLAPAEAWLDREAKSLDGPLPPPDDRLARRFPPV